MNLIMKDYVTPAERLDFQTELPDDYENRECTGCGQTSRDVINYHSCTKEELDDYSVFTDIGLWYCHSDCYRDSR